MHKSRRKRPQVGPTPENETDNLETAELQQGVASAYQEKNGSAIEKSIGPIWTPQLLLKSQGMMEEAVL